MEYNAINNIALILIIFSAIKILVLLVSPKSWMNFAKGIWSKPMAVQTIGFILAALVFYYWYQAGMTVVQLLAASAFVASLMMIGLADTVGSMMKKYDAIVKKGHLWKEYWFYTLVWVVLLVWGVKELFF